MNEIIICCTLWSLFETGYYILLMNEVMNEDNVGWFMAARVTMFCSCVIIHWKALLITSIIIWCIKVIINLKHIKFN